MTTQPARYAIQLRHNIALDGDLTLARLELAALSGTQPQTASIPQLTAKHPALLHFTGLAAPDSYPRPGDAQAFTLTGPLDLLPLLVQRLAFAQRIYATTADTPAARDHLAALEPVAGWQAVGGRLLIQALPHYALMELAGVTSRRAKSVAAVADDLALLLDGLLGRDTGRGARLAAQALKAQSPVALSHDIHYYKAKFFPRLARAMLNFCAGQLGDGPHHVLDNFSGSGTTLLEAATLGLPGVGLDIDPLAVLIAQAKLDVLHLDSARAAGAATRTLHLLGQQPPTPAAFDFPGWLLKNRRMTPAIAADLGGQIVALQTAVAGSDPYIRPLLRVLMSDAIARKIRMRFLGTGVGRFSLTFARTPLHRLFERSLERYLRVIAAAEWLRTVAGLQLAPAAVRAGDARHLPDDLGQFDLLLTSPPYLPASSGRESYARARAPSLIALGLHDREAVDALAGGAIGAMGGGDAGLAGLAAGERDLVAWLQQDDLRAVKAGPTARYFREMGQVFAQMRRALRPGGLAVMVSGKQSTFYQFATRETLYTAPAAALLAGRARQAGFEVLGVHEVQLQKANLNARPRALDDYFEALIVLRQPG